MRPLVYTLLLSLTVSLLSEPAFALSELDSESLQELSQLEQRYFSHAYADESDDIRIERLETLVYGDAVTGDTKQRVKKMFAALPKVENKPQPAVEASTALSLQEGQSATSQPQVAPAMASSAPIDSDEDDSLESYPRITALENIILGQSYVGERLPGRLSRMEAKAFGIPSTSNDLSLRTANLETYAEKTLHKKPLSVGQGQDLANSGNAPACELSSRSQPASGGGQSQLPKQLMNLAGSSLLGIASSALGVPGIVPAMAMTAMRKSGSQPTANQPQAYDSDQPERSLEDPAVNMPGPPPQSAKFITKVGWCEVQLFKRTYPELHLRQRLHQISIELNFDTQKPDIALMDDMPGFIKAIQARNPEIGAASTRPATE